MAAKGLFINSTEQGFTVRGVKNNFFPDNATLAYPANSVILITDDSDMATFRSASNYDVLFSALIKDININGERVTKDNIIETFNEAANKPMSNPDAFTSVEYDGTKSLIFYNDKGDEVANVDVTPFIKDGMVEDVEVLDGNLVIHFNTDSDIKDIYIPLTEIFDPETYYTKQEIDNQVSEIWDTIDEKEEVISTSLNALNEDVENLSNDKQDKLQYYSETDNAENVSKESKIEIEQSNENDSVYAFIEAYTQFTENNKNSYIDLNTNTQIADRLNYTDLSLSDGGIQIYYDKGENGVSESSHIDMGTSGVGSQITIQTTDDSQSTTVDIQPTGVTINDERVLTESDGGYLIDLDTIMTRGLTDAEWDGTIAAVQAQRPIYIKVEGYWCVLQSYHLDGNEMKLLAASDNFVSIYTVTKLGSNQYSLSNVDKQYVSQAEKDAWNAKADASALTAHIGNTDVHFTDGQQKMNYDNLEAAFRLNDEWDIMPQSAFEDFSGDYSTAMGQFDQRITANANAIATKANAADVYTKTAVDEKLADYVDIDTYNGKELATAKALTQLNDTKADKTELPDVSTLATKTELNAKANTADLATVATSGSYNDLTDKPTIPTVPTTVSSFTNDAGYLTNSDISSLEPYTIDLDALIANGVTSTQYDEIAAASADGRVIKATYDGRGYTVESVYVNVDVMKLTVSDELKHHFFQLTKTTGTVSPTTAEYVSLVEKGTWNTKQPLLVSGTNIKTINNQSILGEGNIEIQGGSGEAYYIDFNALTTQGITDADWDGMVAAIAAHKPIYAGLGSRYYTSECLYQDGSNRIIMTASDELSHYFYTFTKNGSNDYSFTSDTRPYTTVSEKNAWNAKADASNVYTKTEIDAMIGNINTVLASI